MCRFDERGPGAGILLRGALALKPGWSVYGGVWRNRPGARRRIGFEDPHNIAGVASNLLNQRRVGLQLCVDDEIGKWNGLTCQAMSLIQLRTIDEMANLAGFDRHGAALALSDTAAARNRNACAFRHRENAGKRRLRRPCQCASRADKMDLARHEAIERGRRGRAEALLENLEDRYAARLQSRADLIHHRIRRAHVDARALAQQFRVDIRRR